MYYDNNTTSVFGYIIEYAFWQVILFIWNRNILFRCIDGLSYYDSISIFMVLVLLSAALSFFSIAKNNRNLVNIIASIGLPMEIYALAAYYPYFPKAVCAVALATVVVLLLYASLMFVRGKGKRSSAIKVFFERCDRFFYRSRVVCAVCLAVVIVPIAFRNAIGEPLYYSKTQAVEASAESTYTIANNIETVRLLEQDKWEQLSMNQRMDVLQVVANIEANYLGLPTELRVTADNLDEYILAQYMDKEYRISVNMEHLKNGSASDVLRTVCHEAYHGYQKRITDVYVNLGEQDKQLRLFSNAEKYAAEFADYQTGEGYYSQAVEEHAREYADGAVDDYYLKIDQYLAVQQDAE